MISQTLVTVTGSRLTPVIDFEANLLRLRLDSFSG